MEQEQRKWGGPRPGSGRPKKAPGTHRVHATFTIEPEVAKAIAERAQIEGVTKSEALTRCIREWKRAHGRQGTSEPGPVGKGIAGNDGR